MHIAIDIRNIGARRTGDETVFLQLVRHLTQIDTSSDNRYHLLIDKRNKEELSTVAEKLRISANERFRLVPLGSGDKFTWNALSVPRYCRQNDIDIYHTQYIVPFVGMGRTRIVTHIHDVSFAALPQYIGRKDLFFLKLLIPPSLRRAAKILAVSEFTKKEIIKHYCSPTEKIEIVPNALGDEFVFPTSLSPSVRRKYSLPDKYVFSLGTMQPRKNIPFLVEVFAQVAQHLPETHLVLSGQRTNRADKMIDKKLDSLSENIKKRIHFTGYIDPEDLPAVYAGAEVFVFPSLYEGFGLPLLEAASQKTPVLASDIEVFREVMGETALYAPVDNLAKFADSLYTVLVDDKLRHRLAVSGERRASLYGWRRSAQRLLSVYREVSQP